MPRRSPTICTSADSHKLPTRKLTLSGEAITLIATLHRRGKSVRDIARLVDEVTGDAVSPTTVQRVIARMRTSNEDVRMALAELRHEAVESWAGAMRTGTKYGRHAPAKDLLMATGTIERDAPSERISIVVGDGTRAIGRLPAALTTLSVLDIKAEPVE